MTELPTWLWIALAVFLLLCYARAVYIVLWKGGFDERNIDAIRWNIKDEPVTNMIYLLICLVIAIPVTLGVIFTGPLWLGGKVVGAVIGT